MATVSASLKIFDQMTRPLQQVTQALNLTISAMDSMNNAANRDIRITNSLNAARNSISRASTGLQELVNSQDRARNSQDNLNNSFNRGINSSDGLSSKVKGLLGTYLGFQAAKKGIDLTIGGGARLEQQLITISGMLGNKDVGKQFFGNLNDYANISVYGLKEFSGITRQFIQFTKNTDKLMTLDKTAERLAFLDPTQGLEGAGFALKEMLGGDGMSLKGRFGFGSGEIKSLKEAKNMDDFINKFNKLLDKKGATQQALQDFNNSAIAQANNLQSNIETGFSQASGNALEALKPLLSTINQGFKNGSFQGFFNGINMGLSLITNGIVGIIDIAKYVSDVFQNNWSAIGPIILGIASALGVYYLALLAVNGAIAISNIVEGISNGIKAIGAAHSEIKAGATLTEAAATKLATGAQIGLNTAILACPLTWIIGLVVGFIVALAAAVAFSDKFREGFANAFQGVANACATAFGAVVQTVENALNWIINKLNSVMEKVNKATQATASLWGGNGTNFHVDNVDFSGYKSFGENFYRNIGSSGAQKIKSFSAENIKSSIKNAMGLGSKAPNTKMPNMDAWNKAQGPGTLSMMDPDSKKHLKNIDDKIDVSNEHLEMLRDLAEMESVQNFVTLTPTVQVTTGDVKEEADINKIIAKIENYMEEELANCAEGVYA